MGWMPPPDGIEVCHAGESSVTFTCEIPQAHRLRIASHIQVYSKVLCNRRAKRHRLRQNWQITFELARIAHSPITGSTALPVRLFPELIQYCEDGEIRPGSETGLSWMVKGLS
jgi:hypothetical protein